VPRRWITLLSLIWGLGNAASSMEEGFLSYSGTARVRHSAQFLYGERHLLHFRDGRLADRVVLYTCSDGSPFARKTATYGDSLAPDFLLEDLSNGMREGVRTDSNGRTVFYRAARGDIERSSLLPRVAGLVVDTGFDEFIRANWQALMAGRTLGIAFLVPSRLDDIAFQVQHLRGDVIGDTPSEVFRLKLSGVLGWVLPGIDAYYSAADHLLVRYEGLSDLRDAGGNNLQTDITYPVSDREPGSEQLIDAARQAPLAPCR
jgi:hypothetical protein